MSSDVVLSSALRTNLLSLQNTQSLIDQTQLRLATGLKVNSALDNPANFFSAQSLNNRASDLTRLLDGISQSIRTIEEADNGVKALTTLVEQADSVAAQAREALSESGGTNATITGTVDLSGETDLGANVSGIDDTDIIRLFTEDEDGDAVTLTGSVNSKTAGVAITIADGDSIDQLITKINDIQNTSDNTQAFKASLTDEGFLEIQTLQGGKLRVEFEDTSNAANANLANGLGFDQFSLSEDAATTAGQANRVGITASNTADIQSVALYETLNSETVVASRSTSLTSLLDSNGSSLDFSGGTADDITISIDGGTAVDLGAIASLSIGEFVDNINDNATLNTKIKASYDETSGVISIEQLDTSVTTVNIAARDTDTATDATIDFRFGIEALDVTNDASNIDVESENLTFGAASARLVGLETDYNTLLAQIDDIVGDASYRGINLLSGDSLETTFNEDESSVLTTEGINFTSAGIGLSEANFKTLSTVSSAENEISDALSSVRNFGNSLANDLSIIQVRQDFTQETINTLESGADDLTVADQNEEGANLLALQTRQTLGVTSLSLASQSQQAVLRLF